MTDPWQKLLCVGGHESGAIRCSSLIGYNQSNATNSVTSQFKFNWFWIQSGDESSDSYRSFSLTNGNVVPSFRPCFMNDHELSPGYVQQLNAPVH